MALSMYGIPRTGKLNSSTRSIQGRYELWPGLQLATPSLQEETTGPCAYGKGSLKLPRTGQEAVNQASNFIGCRIQREVTTIDDMHLCLRDIAAERFRFGSIEREFILSPENEQARLSFTHPFL